MCCRFSQCRLSHKDTLHLVDRVYGKCLDKHREFSIPEQRKEFLSISVRKHLLFEVQPPRSPGLNPLDVLSLGHVKPQ